MAAPFVFTGAWKSAGTPTAAVGNLIVTHTPADVGVIEGVPESMFTSGQLPAIRVFASPACSKRWVTGRVQAAMWVE